MTILNAESPLWPHLVSVELMTLPVGWYPVLVSCMGTPGHQMHHVLVGKEGSQAAACVLWRTHWCSSLFPFPNVLTPECAYYDIQSDHLHLTELSHQLKTKLTYFGP